MCGDHFLNKGKYKGKGGSPPHVRGPQHYNPLTGEVVGITPACAGTTKLQREANRLLGDHPRMCGDHYFMD